MMRIGHQIWSLVSAFLILLLTGSNISEFPSHFSEGADLSRTSGAKKKLQEREHEKQEMPLIIRLHEL